MKFRNGIIIHFSDEQEASLRKASEGEHRSMAAIVREALENYFKSRETTVSQDVKFAKMVNELRSNS